jgi:hypothetical protein
VAESPKLAPPRGLIAELDQLSDPEAFAIWAHRTLPLKNQLTTAEAQTPRNGPENAMSGMWPPKARTTGPSGPLRRRTWGAVILRLGMTLETVSRTLSSLSRNASSASWERTIGKPCCMIGQIG